MADFSVYFGKIKNFKCCARSFRGYLFIREYRDLNYLCLFPIDTYPNQEPLIANLRTGANRILDSEDTDYIISALVDRYQNDPISLPLKYLGGVSTGKAEYWGSDGTKRSIKDLPSPSSPFYAALRNCIGRCAK